MGIIICRGVGSHWVPIYWEKIASERERERLLHQMYSTMLFSIHYWYDHYGLWNRRVRIAIYMITVRTQQSTSMQASIPSGRLHRVLRSIGIIVLVVSIGILGTTNRGWPIALAHTFFPKHQTPNSSPDVDRGGAFLYQLDFHRNRFNLRFVIELVESAALPSYRRWRFALFVGTIRYVLISNTTISATMSAVAVECGGVD